MRSYYGQMDSLLQYVCEQCGKLPHILSVEEASKEVLKKYGL